MFDFSTIGFAVVVQISKMHTERTATVTRWMIDIVVEAD
jgi:hypothetical protein